MRGLTSQRQQPRVTYATGKQGDRLFATAPPPAVAPAMAGPAVFALDAAARMLLVAQGAWTVATAAERADFVLNGATGDLIRRSGDVVAAGVGTAAALGGVIEKWRAIEMLRPLLNEVRARVEVGPNLNGVRYASGAVLDVRPRAGGGGGAYATVFNLAADGTVQTLYPAAETDGEGRLAAGGTLPLVETLVTPPFGADHVVAVVTERDPAELRALVRSLDGQRGAGKLVDAIRRALVAEPGRASLSIGEVYSGN